MLSLFPGATFRRLVTFYEQGRDSPRLDLTDVEFEVVNLNEAPWTIQVLPLDLPQGQVYLYIPDAETKLAKVGDYSFQLRLTYPSTDKQFIQPINISVQQEYVEATP